MPMLRYVQEILRCRKSDAFFAGITDDRREIFYIFIREDCNTLMKR